jgi:hypothetical protein
MFARRPRFLTNQAPKQVGTIPLVIEWFESFRKGFGIRLAHFSLATNKCVPVNRKKDFSKSFPPYN